MITLKRIPVLIIILFLSPLSKAQINTTSAWVWIKGDSTVNNDGYYGVQAVASGYNKPSARFNSVGWKDAANNLWLFGGFGSDYLNDLWKFNTSLNQWIWMKGDSTPSNYGVYGISGISSVTNKPGGRYYSNNWIDNAGNLWLFGGAGYAENGNTGNMSDLWKYTVATGEWIWINGVKTTESGGAYGSIGVTSVNNKPPARDAGVSWKDKSGNLWLFGGENLINSSSYLNDLWKYDVTLNQWTWISGSQIAGSYGVYGTKGTASITNMPGARAASIAWTDIAGNFWLFGGTGLVEAGSLNELNDLWKYDPVSNMWTWESGERIGNISGVYGTRGLPAVNNKPGARVGSSAAADALGNLFLFGGIGYGSAIEGSLNDFWKYNIATNQWTWLKGDSTLNNNGIYGSLGTIAISNKPGSRFGNTSWADSSGNVYLFGGTGYANTTSDHLNDLWKIDIANATLPLTLLNLSAALVRKEVIVNWQTTQQVNTAYFIIEHSIDGIKFSKVGLVPANIGTSSTYSYSFTDNQPFAGNNFYRIKIMDNDGGYTYSKIVEVSSAGKIKLQLFPNPVSDMLFVEASGNFENAVARIFDISGRKIIQQKIKLDGNVSFSISLKDISNGTYILILQKQGSIETQKFVKG